MAGEQIPKRSGDEDLVESLVMGNSILTMPQFPPSDIQGIIKTFNMYVKFPKSRWPEIKQAEADTPEADRIYDKLKAEYMERFWNLSDNFEEAAQEKVMGAPMSS